MKLKDAELGRAGRPGGDTGAPNAMPGGPRALVRPGSGPHGYESSQGTSECPFDSRCSGAVWGEGMQTILANFQNLERLKLTPTYKNKKDWLFFLHFRLYTQDSGF